MDQRQRTILNEKEEKEEKNETEKYLHARRKESK